MVLAEKNAISNYFYQPFFVKQFLLDNKRFEELEMIRTNGKRQNLSLVKKNYSFPFTFREFSLK